MFTIIQKFFQGNKRELVKDIISFYNTKKHGIISYVYGATMVKYNLLWQGKKFVWHNIKNILLDADFLLPDGAAIRTMYSIGRLLNRRWWKKALNNLNWTDFLPYFLEHLHDYWYSISIVTLTVYDPRIGNEPWYLKQGAREYIQNHRPNFAIHGEEVYYGDSWYDLFDWSGIEEFLESTSWWGKEQSINLLLNFRGWSYGAPHQELFAYINRPKLQELQLLCMNQGATVDFWIGREQRAPQWIRRLRLESAYRLFSDPKKNRKKFLISFKMIWLIVTKVIIWSKKAPLKQ